MCKKICSNKKCSFNNDSPCAAVEGCPGFEMPNCMSCLHEYNCDWKPDVCHYVPDPFMKKEANKDGDFNP